MKMIHFKEKYKKEVIPAMMEKFGYKNKMAVPKISKICLNTSFGKQIAGKTSSERNKLIGEMSSVLAAISGQKPAFRKARISVAAFKLRKGIPIGLMVTLRGKKMYDFLERLCWLVFPRTRDFRGISLKSFDKNGNLTVGFKDYSSFPEVIVNKEKSLFGLEVTITTTAKTKEEGIWLLRFLGFPLKKEFDKRK